MIALKITDMNGGLVAVAGLRDEYLLDMVKGMASGRYTTVTFRADSPLPEESRRGVGTLWVKLERPRRAV